MEKRFVTAGLLFDKINRIAKGKHFHYLILHASFEGENTVKTLEEKLNVFFSPTSC